jgi:hypothetical protein
MKILIWTIVLFFGLTSCANNSQQQKNSDKKVDASTLEVMYFHGKQRCITCRAIETLAEEVLEKEYPKQLKDGDVVFRIIDFSTQEGEAEADKYEVSFASLLLVKGDSVINLTDMAFSYAKNEPEVFKAKLKEEIDKILK